MPALHMVFLPTPFVGFVAGLAAFVSSAAGGTDAADGNGRHMVVSDEYLIRVTIGVREHSLIEWTEQKGPKCLPASAIAGAAIAGPSSIDFLMRDRSRFRAQLDDDCGGLDFYGDFYVEPQDGAVCAKREEIHSRVGSSCRIDRFRRLVPHLKR